MILTDAALARRERDAEPIRVGMVGAGFMGRGIALQIVTATTGMRLVAIANRTSANAERAWHGAGLDPVLADDATSFDAAAEAGRPVITRDPALVCGSQHIDAVIEVTGTIGYAARVALDAIEHGKHVILMNAELDGTVGPILKQRADDAGVIITNADGDQPGVIMNLYRFVRGIGVRPVLCGNIKGLHDPYRNPTTQEGFARKWGQDARMVTSFADGTKISFEQAIVANATGMGVSRRGMWGPTVEPGTPLEHAVSSFPVDQLLDGPGVVDYVVGAAPSPGVFVLGTHDDSVQRTYLRLYKLGDGPLYCFSTPHHLCHFEVPTTVARAVLFGDATIAPIGPPRVEVVAVAKEDLRAGRQLDGIGGYATYGVADDAGAVARENLLPMGVAEGCTVTRDVPRDAVLTYADVDVPTGRFVDELRQEQRERFPG